MQTKLLALFAFSVLCQAIDVTAGTSVISRCGQIDQSPVASCDIRFSTPAQIERISVTKVGEKKDRVIDSQKFSELETATSTLIIVDRNRRIGVQTMQVIREEIQTIFVNSVSEKRQIGLASFSDKLTFLAPVGSGKAELSRALNLLQTDSDTSNINRSAISAINSLSRLPSKRKHLIIISNGINQIDYYSASDVIFKAREAQVSVHGLAFVERLSQSNKLQGLRHIANETSGIFVRANLSDKRLPLEFSNQYFDTIESGAVISLSTDRRNETQQYLLSVNLASGNTIDEDIRFAVSNIPASSLFSRLVGIDHNLGIGLIILAGWMVVSVLALCLFRIRKKQSSSGRQILQQNYSTEFTETPGIKKYFQIPKELARGPLKVDNSVEPEIGQSIPRLDSPRFVSADDQDQVWHIAEENMKIGRASDNDIRFSDPTVHRHHAVIVRAPEGTVLITDISGLEGNGVYVNNERVIYRELQPGDSVEFGAVHLVYLTGNSISVSENDKTDYGQVGSNSTSPSEWNMPQTTESKLTTH